MIGNLFLEQSSNHEKNDDQNVEPDEDGHPSIYEDIFDRAPRLHITNNLNLCISFLNLT